MTEQIIDLDTFLTFNSCQKLACYKHNVVSLETGLTTQAEILNEWPRTVNLKEHIQDYKTITGFIEEKTKFGMYQNADTPSLDSDIYFQNEDVFARCTFPYKRAVVVSHSITIGEIIYQSKMLMPYVTTRENHNEVILLDLDNVPPSTAKAGQIFKAAGFISALGNEVFNRPTYVTLLAPRYGKEIFIDTPHPTLEDYVRDIHYKMFPENLTIPTPGTHCNITVTRGKQTEWLCPYRQGKTCKPFLI